MKKIALAILFFTSNLYSQDHFKFDFYTDYDIKVFDTQLSEKLLENSLVFTNTADENYYLIIIRNIYNSGKTIALLNHKKKNLDHYFSLIENKENSINSASFHYLFSVKWNPFICNDNYIVESFDTNENPDFNTKVLFYKNKKKKKIMSCILLNKSVSNKSCFNNFKKSLGHFDPCDKLKLSSLNYLITSAAFLNIESGKITRRLELINSGVIDFNVHIKDLNYKSQIEMYSYFKEN